LKIGYISSLQWENISTNDCFRLHIYLLTNKILIRNYIYIYLTSGEKVSHEKEVVQLQYENVYRKGRVDLDNRRFG